MPGTRATLLLAATLTMGATIAWSAPKTQASAVAHPSRWPAAHSPSSITDAATEKRITDLLAKMTLEEKVGQMVQADICSITPEDLPTYPLGSILAGGNSGPDGNERGSAADWHRLVASFRAARPKSPPPTGSASRSCSASTRSTATATSSARRSSRTTSASARCTIPP